MDSTPIPAVSAYQAATDARRAETTALADRILASLRHADADDRARAAGELGSFVARRLREARGAYDASTSVAFASPASVNGSNQNVELQVPSSKRRLGTAMVGSTAVPVPLIFDEGLGTWRLDAAELQRTAGAARAGDGDSAS